MATMWSPACARLSSVLEMALMPELMLTAAVPPSSAAMRFSSTSLVGFEKRTYE